MKKIYYLVETNRCKPFMTKNFDKAVEFYLYLGNSFVNCKLYKVIYNNKTLERKQIECFN